MSNKDDFLEELSELANQEDDRIWSESHLDGYSDFYKENEASKVWWIDKLDAIGALERVLFLCTRLGGDPISPSDRVIMQ